EGRGVGLAQHVGARREQPRAVAVAATRRADLQRHHLTGRRRVGRGRERREPDDHRTRARGEHPVPGRRRLRERREPRGLHRVDVERRQRLRRQHVDVGVAPRGRLDRRDRAGVLGDAGADADVGGRAVPVAVAVVHPASLGTRCGAERADPVASGVMAHPSRSFGSVSVAMVTPMHPDGSIDIDSSRRLATHLVDSGCDALVVNGTTGESPTTHTPEKDQLISAVVDEVGDRAMVVAGAGSNDTAHAVRIAESAHRAGAHGLLVVTPYYNRPSQEGVYRHMLAIVESTPLPVMLYDIPGRTGVAIGDETLDRLAEHPQVRAVKDATGDGPPGLGRMRPTGLEFYSGDDTLNLAWLVHGAAGVVSVVGHLVAGSYAAMVSAVDDGDLETARDISARLAPVCDAIMGGGQGAVMAKAALQLQGV